MLGQRLGILIFKMNKEDLWKSFENINYWIQNCDNKIMIIFGFIGALGFFTDRRIFSVDFSQPEIFIWTNILLATSFILFYISSIYFLFNSIYPKINARYNSSLFFGNISKKSFKEFNNDISSSSYSIEEDLKKQIHINSRIAIQKYNSFKKSLVSLGLSLLIYLIIRLIWL